METGHTARLSHWLDAARNGDADARSRIIDHACERLRLLTRKMLRGYPKVKRWSETDDVLQNAMIRLHRSLITVTPETPRLFYGLAATQIRRELIDLARSQNGPHGVGTNHNSDHDNIVVDQPAQPLAPESLSEWSRFHEQVDQLPDDQREIVNLLWYEGLSQPEAATVIGVSLATVKRRWQAARMTLFETLRNLDLD